MRAAIRAITAAAAIMSLAAGAAAQRPPDAYTKAIAAGYKASILCSAVFIGGRSEADVEAVELKGIYPEYAPIVPTLTAKVDRRAGMVEVPFDAKLPPRRAVFRPGTGCVNMPIGSVAAAGSAPPAPAPADPRPWPLGDALPKIAFLPLASVATAFDGVSYGKGTVTTGVVVVAGNRLIAERYADGFGPFVAQRTWSVAKSITGTLVGLAGLNPTAKAPIAAWQTPGDPRASITVDNLVRMASGLHSDTAGNRTDAIYFGGTSVSENVPQWPLEASPGTRFRYANNDILLAMLSIRATIGEARYKDFPAKALFGPLGMAHTVAETDWRGNYVSSSQVWTTARDLARFGMLYANGGMWNGKRVLPAAWIDYVTRPSGPQPDGSFGYGATFWLLNKSPGVPAETFAAIGNRGQYVVIVPSRNVVIVRRGEDPAGASFDIAKFTADVLATIK